MGNRISDQSPQLRMPFPAGAVALCQQGNGTPEILSHSRPNCFHALDFYSLNSIVVAAAAGNVIEVFRGAQSGDKDGGYGFGNFVKLDHALGYYTFYAHLADVFVEPGHSLRSGEPLGTLGDTGWAGNRHLHFSLHQGKFDVPGVVETIPFTVLCADLNGDRIFTFRPGEEFIHSGAVFNLNGHIYASENDPERPCFAGCVADIFSNGLSEEFHALSRFVKENEQIFPIG